MCHGKHQPASQKRTGCEGSESYGFAQGDQKGFTAKAPPEKDLNEMREQAMRLFGGKSVPGRQNSADV